MISIFFTQNGLFVESDTGKAIRDDYTIKRTLPAQVGGGSKI